MYFNCKKVKDAEQLFLNMQQKDLVSWNIIIFGYSQNCWCREAQSLLKKFHSGNYECSLLTLLGILLACDSPSSIQFVDSFKLLEEIAYTAGVDTWNTVISGCTQNGHFGKLLMLSS